MTEEIKTYIEGINNPVELFFALASFMISQVIFGVVEIGAKTMFYAGENFD